jgi:putative endonuclease
MVAAWVYIVTNRPNASLYVGITANLPKRIWEHREAVMDDFSKTYGLKRLVYVEPHETILGAIQREKNMKHWSRAWKVNVILEQNPGWADLYDSRLG